METLFSPGTIFLDTKASNIQGIKPKYFIGISKASDETDKIVCFVLNTEKYPEKLKEGCNKEKEKFFLQSNKFGFLTNPTSIMLNRECLYSLKEIINEKYIKIIDEIDEITLRQIINCIKKENISLFNWELIKAIFK